MARLNLTRHQIARIVGNDPDAIRAFEALLSQASPSLPDAVESAELSAAVAELRAVAVLEAAKDLTQALASIPPVIAAEPDMGLPPPPSQYAEAISLADLAPPGIGGANGTFTTSDPFTVTVVDGRIVSIV